MKIFKVVVVLASMLLCVAPVWAQFTIFMSETDQVLTTTCGGVTPIPDGTQVQIIWDRGAEGESVEDTLAPLCANPPQCLDGPVGTVTINSFVMNGVAVELGEGYFYMESSLGSVGTIISPNAFYLRICLPTCHWVSNTLSNADGYVDREMGPWTCVNAPCAGCPAPPAVSLLSASDDLSCHGVSLTWSYPDTVTSLDRFYIARDGARIDSTGPLARAYTDSTASPQLTYQYSVIARRHCLDGSNGLSTPVIDAGMRHASPPIPTSMAASTNTCDSVRVSWTYNTNAGIDSFIIKRDGTRVGAILVTGSAGPRFWYHVTSTRGPGNYTVVGRNPVCGEGTPSAVASGEAQQEPLIVADVAATDGLCDSTVVTWTDASNETSYHVYRSLADGTSIIDLTSTGLAANTVRYRDASGTYGTNYRYWVVAINGCGSSVVSVYDLGARVTTPTAPGTFNASDATFCTHTAMTWADIPTESSYQILRNLNTNTDTIATLPANTTSYNDSLGSPGTVYNYSVRAVNGCGAAISLVNTGSRATTPAQVATLTATDGTICTGVTLSWQNVAAEQGYRVYRDSAIIGSTIADVTTYTDLTAAPGVHYGYAVLAYNTCGNGLGSAVDSGYTRTVPEQVTGLAASDTSCANIHLVWNDVAGDTAYQVFRGATLIGSTATGVTTYTDAGAGEGNIDYHVVAVNGCGAAVASATVTGSRLPSTPLVTNIVATEDRCDSVIVTWTDIAGEDSFAVRRDAALIGTVPANATRFAYLPTDSNAVHTYTVIGYNNCGLGLVATGDAGARLGRPAQVTGVAATEDSCTNVRIAWTTQAFSDSFVVARDGVRLGATLGTVTTFTDASGVPGTVYNYTVQAFNACGAGVVSAADAGHRLIAPALPQNLSASVTHCDRVALSWTASTGDVDHYNIYRGATLVATIAGTLTTYDDAAAPTGISSYTVSAVSDQCGETALSTAASGERLVTPGVPPSVTASSNLCSGVHLTWGTTTGDVDSFRVYQGGTLIATVAAGVLSYDAVPGAPGVYQYRIAGYSNDCAVEGSQSTAVPGTMLAQPTAVSAIQYSTTRCDGILLSWVAGTGAVTGYIIVRDGVELDTTDAATTNYADNAATVGAHSYVVRTYSATCSEPTPPTAVVAMRQPAPTAPAGVAATTTACDSVVVTWTASTGTLDSYKLYRDGALRATIPAGQTRYAEITVSGVDHRYTVTAFDDVCGETDSTAGATGRRISDVGIPQDVTATGVCPGVTVAWTAATGVPLGYRIHRGGTLLREVASTATSFTDSTAAYGTPYTYKVLAFSALCGETAFSNEATGTRIPLPTQVTGLSPTTNVCSGVNLIWNAADATDQFKIYRDDVLLDSVVATLQFYADTTALPGSTHSYKVAAENSCGIGAFSVSVTGSRPDVPGVVTGLAASDTSCAAVHLVWTDVATETGYVITRDGTALDSVAAGIVQYMDATAAAATPYVYAVIAKNTCGRAAASTTANGTRVPATVQVAGVAATSTYCDSVVVTWTDQANEAGYRIFRDGGSTPLGAVGAGILTFADLTAAVGTHTYTVAAFNSCGQGTVSAGVSGVRFAAPPQVTVASATQDSCTSITLTWTDIATEDKYYIYRGATLIDSTLADVTTYRENGLTAGAYVYTVRPLNYCGLGLASADINGRVPSVPGIVTNMLATSDRCDSVIVTWTDLPDEINYQIFRNGTALGFLDANVTRYADRPDSGVAVNYQIKGINACGVGELNIPPALGTRLKLPNQVADVMATDNACGNITVGWTNVEGATAYNVYRDGVLVATQTNVTAGSADDVNPPAGTYQYTVAAVNTCGIGPVSLADAGSKLPTMSAVTLSTASTTYCDSIVITWADLTGEIGYRVLRDDVQIAELGPDVVRYDDLAATAGAHNYMVLAYNVCGAGPASNVLSGTRLGAPAAATNVAASENSCTNVVITWTDVANETGYRVYRDGTFIGSTAAGVTTFTDVPEVGTYLYAVSSFNVCDSAALATDNGTRLTTPLQVTGVAATTTRCDSIVITWTDLASDSAYQILRGGVQIASVLQNVVRYADAPTAGTYLYAVRAINRCGTGPNSLDVTGTRVQTPSVPASITVRDSCGMVGVRWGAATGAVNSYYIYRGAAVVQVVSADTTDRFWIDHVAAGTYAYSVRAHSNLCGDGPATAAANGSSFATPSTPTNVQAAAAMCDSVRLTWTASTGTVTGYVIRRDLVVIDTVSALRFVDTELNDARSHAYSVASYNNACGLSAYSTVTFGHLRSLLEITTDLPDTLYSAQQYRVDYLRCGGVQTDSVFLSLNNGVYTFLDMLTSTQSFDTLTVPMVSGDMPNSHFRIISTRGTRRDTLTGPAFVIRPPLAGSASVESTIPTEFFLDQNYPNPFNPLTSIRYGVPRASEVKVVIYDLMGREVATLVNGTLQPGVHTITWDCSHCPSGMYMLRLESPDRVLMRKMLLMK